MAEQLARSLRVRWIVLGGVAAAQCILAGHPQIALYALALTGAYFVFRALQIEKGRAAYFGAFLSMMVLALMLTAVQKAGGTYVTDVFHHFAPHGVSGVIVIAESHVTIHTWPEHGYAAADVFTCGSSFAHSAFTTLMREGRKAVRVEAKTIERGRLPFDATPVA